MNSERIGRRSVAKGLAGFAVLAAAPFSFMPDQAALPSSLPASLAEVLAQFARRVIAPLADAELLELAAAGRRQAAVRNATTIAAEILGEEPERLLPLSVAEVRTRIEQNIRADFAAQRTASVDGWILSRTELLALSLAQTLSGIPPGTRPPLRARTEGAPPGLRT